MTAERISGTTRSGTTFNARGFLRRSRKDYSCDLCGGQIVWGAAYWSVLAFTRHTVCTVCVPEVSAA